MVQVNASSSPKRYKQGFSLTEMLTVIAIGGILLTIAGAAVASVMSSANLTTAGQLVVGKISLARQEAVTTNREVEVLFYNLTTGSRQGWCGVQIWRVDPTASGTTNTAVTPLTILPAGIIISTSSSYSPLLTAETSLEGTATLPVQGTAKVTGFGFRPNGSLDYAVTSGNAASTPAVAPNNFIMLQNASAGNNPKNFITIQINPNGGKVTIFRP